MAVTALETEMVEACVRSLEGTLDATPTSSWTGTDPAVARDLLNRLARVEARISAHKMAAARVLEKARQAARDATRGGADGAGPATTTSTSSTISIDFGGDRHGAADLVNTATRIEEQTTHTEAALAAGEISTKQADVISRALGSLPDGVTEAQRDTCERTLLKDAQKFTLKDLRARARRITETYRKTEDEVDADEDAFLRQQEEQACSQAHVCESFHGSWLLMVMLRVHGSIARPHPDAL